MPYLFEKELRQRAEEYISSLKTAGIAGEIAPNSFRNYTVKVSVIKNGINFGNCNLYYGEKKGFSIKFHELRDRSIEPELEKCWFGQMKQAEFQTKAVYQAYVDGSFNDGSTGYGAVILKNGEPIQEFSGEVSDAQGSHQVAGELFAVQMVIKWCQENKVDTIAIFYDYKGIEDLATGKWQAAKSISQDYAEFIKNCGITVEWHKVKSHTGNRWNDRADELAKQGCITKKKAEVHDNQDDDIHHIEKKVTEFIERINQVKIGATIKNEGILNNMYNRVIFYDNEKKVGVGDFYNTKKRPLSSPYWHDFKDKGLQQKIDNLWKEFYSGKTSNGFEAVPHDTTLQDVEYYYNILKPYESYEFDFIHLAEALNKALAKKSVSLTIAIEKARYDFQLLEKTYREVTQ